MLFRSPTQNAPAAQNAQAKIPPDAQVLGVEVKDPKDTSQKTEVALGNYIGAERASLPQHAPNMLVWTLCPLLSQQQSTALRPIVFELHYRQRR